MYLNHRFLILGASCLWLAKPSLVSADPVGLVTVDDRTSPFAEAAGLQTCNVYVQFDSPLDNLLSVGFADIGTNAPAGFYQNPFGGDTPPYPAICLPSPPFELVCSDSFVTIGCKDSTCTESTVFPDQDFESAVFNPPPPQNMLIGGWFNGSFSLGPCPACPEDLTGNGVINVQDLAILLGSWGENPGSPADFDGDGIVGATDLAILLQAGGPGSAIGSPDANLQVLIAQLTVQAGFPVLGSLTVFFNDGTMGIPFSFSCFCECDSDNPADPACDDGNPCTDDTCGSGCFCSHANNSAPCTDGIFCNGVDTCSGGTCSSHPGDPCTGGLECANTCNEGAGNCFDLAGSSCGSGVVTGCDNADQCDGFGHCQANNAPNGSQCDDSDDCTTNDSCSDGDCAGTTADLTGDGIVNASDLAILLGAWGQCP